MEPISVVLTAVYAMLGFLLQRWAFRWPQRVHAVGFWLMVVHGGFLVIGLVWWLFPYTVF